MTHPTPATQPEAPVMPCPFCAEARRKYDRLDRRMAARGNFGIVPLPLKCKKHAAPRPEPGDSEIVDWLERSGIKFHPETEDVVAHFYIPAVCFNSGEVIPPFCTLRQAVRAAMGKETDSARNGGKTT